MSIAIERRFTALLGLAIAACTGRTLGDGGGDGAAPSSDDGDRDETSFGGVSLTSGPHDDGADITGDVTTSAGSESGPTLPCNGVLAESRACVVFDAAADVQAVGLDSGQVCPLLAVDWSAPPLQVSGIAWNDDAYYVCTGTVQRIDADDGSVADSGRPCSWLAGREGALLVYDFSSSFLSVLEYASWDELVAGGPATVHSVDGMQAEIFAAHDELIYGAWHSTDAIARRVIDSGSDQPTLALESFDDWVYGLDVVGGELIVTSTDGLHRFDAGTGTQLGQQPLTWPTTPVACRED